MARIPTLTGCFLLLALAAPAGQCDDGPLRVAWGSHNAPPYAITENGMLVDGFIRDLGLQVARRLDVSAEFVNVPRTRYESQLRNGEIDLVCIVNRDWLENPGEFIWTQALFREADILVQRTGDATWQYPADLQGKRLGTILGYRYPTLEPMFDHQLVQRDDAADLDSNLQRLTSGRIDGVVDADIPIRYWLVRNDRSRRLQLASLVVSGHEVSCAVSTRSRHGAQRIANLVNRLVRRGIVNDLLRGYLVAD